MKLVLNKVCLHVKLGIHSWEKVFERLVWINLAISSNAILDYDLIIKLLDLSTSGKQFDYIEELAKTLSSALIKQFDPIKLSLEIIKPSLSKSLESASVQFEYNT